MQYNRVLPNPASTPTQNLQPTNYTSTLYFYSDQSTAGPRTQLCVRHALNAELVQIGGQLRRVRGPVRGLGAQRLLQSLHVPAQGIRHASRTPITRVIYKRALLQNDVTRNGERYLENGYGGRWDCICLSRAVPQRETQGAEKVRREETVL